MKSGHLSSLLELLLGALIFGNLYWRREHRKKSPLPGITALIAFTDSGLLRGLDLGVLGPFSGVRSKQRQLSSEVLN